MQNKFIPILVTVLLLGGCEFNPDTNGVYYKAETARPVKCVQDKEYRIRCYSYGERVKLNGEAK